MGKILKIPVQATFRVVDGVPVMVDAKYMEASADDLAAFFVEQYNRTHPGKEVVHIADRRTFNASE